MKVLVLYYSKTGHTLNAVQTMIKGIIESGSTAEAVSVKEFKNSMLSEYDSLVVASPCWGGSSGLLGVAKPLVKVLKSLDAECLKDKLCGGISIHSFSGGKATISHIKKLLSTKGCTNFKRGPIGKAGTPMSIGKGKSINSEDEIRFKEFGMEFLA